MSNSSTIILSAKRTQLIIWTLLSITLIIGMAVDLVAPSLPAIAADLHVADSAAKNAIAIYLLGYALGNFFTGFLADAYGRKKLIRISLLGFVIVSVLPIFFPYISILLIARFLQGITIGAASVLARAIFSDVLPPEKLVRLGPLIAAIWGLGPVSGPIIGGYLQFYFGWKAGFYFFSIFAAISFIAVYCFVPETHSHYHPLRIKTIKNNFIEVISHQIFIAIVLLMGLAYSLIIAFHTAAPFLIQTVLHHTPVFFGHLALLLGIFFLAATIICRRLIKKYRMSQLFFITINMFFLFAILMLILSYSFSESIFLIAFTSIMMFFASGIIYPLSMGKGISYFRHIAGTATAIMYLFNVLITSLTSFLVSLINIKSVIPLMWIYFILFLLCVMVYWSMMRSLSHE